MQPNTRPLRYIRLIDVRASVAFVFRLEEPYRNLDAGIIRLPKWYRVEPALPEEVLQSQWEIDTHLTRPADEFVEGDVSILHIVQPTNVDRPTIMTLKEVITARLTEWSFIEGLIGVDLEPQEGKETEDTVIDLTDYNYVISENRPIWLKVATTLAGDSRLLIARRYDSTEY